ncbi:hypothetical protein [Streptomyces sp. T21Q-yed]|uniref:hypothetical protein n=1 Tax=Streptomyces sp. T21Q-yed TaxID=3018441 RepID=UPI0023DEF75B|nr:hypothetical protein [Streptomyces sp. T21Q-yed]MDF3139929.1 hypothetical protein [Streptomyces sp. T21Q-yed]
MRLRKELQVTRAVSDTSREILHELWDLKFGCTNPTARFISTALSVLLDELAHRARHIELAGEPGRSTSHLVWG